MKRMILLMSFVLLTMSMYAQQYYGRVSDPDGYTNIRSGPSTSYPIKSRYNSGDYLYYTPESSGWSKVYSGQSSSTYMGYMHTSRILKVNPNSSSSASLTYTFSSNYYLGRVTDPDGYTNIRRGPSTSDAICRRYNSGDYLYYIPESNGWSKVYSGNSSSTFMGYMHTSRINRIESSPSRPITSTPFPDHLSNFFQSKDNQAYKVILRLAHPSNTFKSGYVSTSGGNVIVTIYSKDARHSNLCAKFRIRKDGAYFSSIECIEDDDFTPAFFFTDMLKSLLANYIDNNEQVKQVEGYFGLKLSNMSAQKACIAILSVLLWKY